MRRSEPPLDPSLPRLTEPDPDPLPTGGKQRYVSSQVSTLGDQPSPRYWQQGKGPRWVDSEPVHSQSAKLLETV
jgi:hypothetical protein